MVNPDGTKLFVAETGAVADNGKVYAYDISGAASPTYALLGDVITTCVQSTAVGVALVSGHNVT